MEIFKKHEHLSKVKQELWKLETQQGVQEMQNCVLDDKVAELRKGMQRIQTDISLLLGHEAASVKTLGDVLELKKKEIDVEFDEKLTHIKVQLVNEIETSVSEMKQKDLARKEMLLSQVSELQEQINSSPAELKKRIADFEEDQENRVSSLRKCADSKVASIQSQTHDLMQNIAKKQKLQKSLQDTLQKDLKRTATHFDTTLHALRQKQIDKESQKQALLDQITAIQSRVKSLQSSVEKHANCISYCEDAVGTYREKYGVLEAERRLLHNKLQELKGNIRVFCRVKPCKEDSQQLIPMQISSQEDLTPDGKQVLVLDPRNTSFDYSAVSLRGASMMTNVPGSRGSSQRFELDRVFGADAQNSDIFLEISQLVQSSLDGFNVCVFAYGQTGSGKTWTMSHDTDGMIPLSIAKIFSDIEELTAQGWEYTIDGQFVEIYNELIIDLLGRGNKDFKREIKHDDTAKHTTITNCTAVRLQSRDQALEILLKATLNRSTASTLMNSRSSRSHSVFMLKISGRNEKSNSTCEGTLNLIDLAGSERLNSSQAKGARLKETQAINKSLSSLGDVIQCLGERQKYSRDINPAHVPYRNSKLTYLLKHSLGGDSKTLMFVNVSANVQNVSETINSLRFAKKVNGTKLNSSDRGRAT
ncbi:kinesin-domain-containing protein [Metschnikowia bicuspidata var. bicuspidata NRRL YB-4993]|uniref:Kinesin-like protein n=1 Tax=Metschnikowia bicuspidata var. bicuspidata NRRL YB-4993 TaxID=869754 RepID=A0A1A0HIP0_9ASCO|nr:kinesin-domain-containing protein [Metschnikowia bicuspidata var. bicuspidata NRRL YB-4993]OBA23871.1 kinesin-domain-containing protein [Metschnikowia bicuspidata var. bicuspidata NRRL YB-4993]